MIPGARIGCKYRQPYRLVRFAKKCIDEIINAAAVQPLRMTEDNDGEESLAMRA